MSLVRAPYYARCGSQEMPRMEFLPPDLLAVQGVFREPVSHAFPC